MNNKDILVYIFDSDLKQYFQDGKVNLIDFANFWIINLYKKHSIDVEIINYKNNNNSLLFDVILKTKNNTIKIIINFLVIDLNSYNESFWKNFSSNIVDYAYDLVKNTFANVYSEYKDEPIDQFKRSEIKDLIFRKITNICNGWVNYGIIEFINDIFISIITEHKLQNGNKRIAQAILIVLLSNFGYYFKYSNLPKNCCSNQKINLKEQLIKMLENYTKDPSDNNSRFEKLRIESNNKYIWDNILISFYKR